MEVSVQCECGARYRVPESAAGKHARCKKCGARMTIPPLEEVSEPDVLGDLGALAEGAAIAQERPAAVSPAVAQPASVIAAAAPNAAVASGAAARGRDYFAAVGRTLACPLRPRNLAIFLVMWFIVCLRIPMAFACIFGLIGILFIQAYYWAFCMNVVLDAAGGEEDLTQPTLTGAWLEDVIIPAFKFFMSWVVVRVPVAVYLLVIMLPQGLSTDEFTILIRTLMLSSFEALVEGGSGVNIGIFALLYLAGVFFWPIVLLIFAVGGMSGILRIDLILKTVVKTFPAYVSTVVLTYMALAIPFIYALVSVAFTDSAIVTLLVMPIVFFGLGVYSMIVAMRVIGMYYHHFKDRFAFSWG